jgi:hypothetical protein
LEHPKVAKTNNITQHPKVTKTNNVTLHQKGAKANNATMSVFYTFPFSSIFWLSILQNTIINKFLI